MTRFTPDEAAQVVAEYAAGLSLAQLAERYHTTVPTILRYLDIAGVARRPQGGANNPNGRRGKHGQG